MINYIFRFAEILCMQGKNACPNDIDEQTNKGELRFWGRAYMHKFKNNNYIDAWRYIYLKSK